MRLLSDHHGKRELELGIGKFVQGKNELRSDETRIISSTVWQVRTGGSNVGPVMHRYRTEPSSQRVVEPSANRPLLHVTAHEYRMGSLDAGAQGPAFACMLSPITPSAKDAGSVQDSLSTSMIVASTNESGLLGDSVEAALGVVGRVCWAQ
jgi:hypothetical protein